MRCGCQGSWHLPGGGTPSTAVKIENLGGTKAEPGTTHWPALLHYPVLPIGQPSPGTGLLGLGINVHTITDILGAADHRIPGVRRPKLELRLCLQPAAEACASFNFLSLGLSFLICPMRRTKPTLSRSLKSSNSQMAL